MPPRHGPHLIEPDDNLDPTPLRYPLRSRTSPRRTTPVVQCHGATTSRYRDATRLLLAAEAKHTEQAHAVIDEVTGKSLEYRHLIQGPTKDV